MGSGCGSSNNFGRCTDDQMTSSHCVNWQGQSYENLKICSGDTLTEVGNVILDKLELFAKAEGIYLKDLTVTCDDLNVKLKNSDYSLYQIVKLALENQCGLQKSLDDLGVIVDGLKITVDASKLCVDATTTSQIQQCVIDNVVDIKKALTNLTTELGDVSQENNTIINTLTQNIGDYILRNINSCNGGIQKNGTGSQATLDFVGIVPPGGYLWGEFDVSKFDSTGLGNGIYCGFALANGKNGTIDMRHNIPSMASVINGVSRTFLDTTNIGDRKGADKITLSSNQLPDHEHLVVQQPHTHTYKYQGGTSIVGKNSGSGENAGGTNQIVGTTSADNVDLKVKGVQGMTGLSIDIRQSTVYQVWIKRVSGFTATNNNPFVIDKI